MGFGIDFAVRLTPADKDDEDILYGKVGEFFWDGAASNGFWVDPGSGLSVVMLTQRFPFSIEPQKVIRRAVYDALDSERGEDDAAKDSTQ